MNDEQTVQAALAKLEENTALHGECQPPSVNCLAGLQQHLKCKNRPC